MDVHWLEQYARDVPAGEDWLSPAERLRLAGLRIPKRRADWRLGRWTAKCATAAYYGLSRNPGALAEIELRAAPSGAPQLFLRGCRAPLYVSLSHSAGVGLCVLAGGSVGCDLETVDPRSPAFVADFFTAQERQLVEHASPVSRDLLVTLLWSAKESALKALGCGLRSDTRAVRTTPLDFPGGSDGEWRRITMTHRGGQSFCGWWRDSEGLVRTMAQRSGAASIAPPPRALDFLTSVALASARAALPRTPGCPSARNAERPFAADDSSGT